MSSHKEVAVARKVRLRFTRELNEGKVETRVVDARKEFIPAVTAEMVTEGWRDITPSYQALVTAAHQFSVTEDIRPITRKLIRMSKAHKRGSADSSLA